MILVTGTRADEEVELISCKSIKFHANLCSCDSSSSLFNVAQTIDKLIETGDSEQIFQKAIQEQGRGQVSLFFPLHHAISIAELNFSISLYMRISLSCILNNFWAMLSCLKYYWASKQ